jgi:hypothetical protein
MRLTLANVRNELRRVGLLIQKSDGEYRVAFPNSPGFDPEASAYYTDDLEDALGTGLAMAAHRHKRNPARKSKRSRAEARALVKRYGGRARAREVAGGMIGTATSREQREHFVRVRKSINPIQKDVNYKKQFWIFTPPGEGGFEYGWDGVTPIRMRVTFAANPPKGSRYYYTMASRMVNTPAFQAWYKAGKRDLFGTKRELIAQLEAISAGTHGNPKQREPDAIAHRPGPGGRGVWYVTELPGQGGKDWGYGNASRAIPLSPYWQRRFAADMARVGSRASFIRGNPKRRHAMPLTPEDRGILRAMTREHGKRAVARGALQSNPVPMFPMYVRKGSSAPWALLAVFVKLDNARFVGNLVRLRGYQVRVTDGKK